ncbi:Ribonuclease HI [Botrimarina colliarenosi]|uniref:Ribonuclease HI n=1 Tax=Botrimarina colliarenosi TaxID=2528001 RepID=A0A5C6A8Y3_9BACT|nr:RNase H family protein [Botrimarina colliarenosi]TWT95886.1 Ribonuclease HI [Botrimarina colliarenosi]
MQASRPRFVLIAETEQAGDGALWRFALHAADASVTVAACDSEEGADDDRLVLLAMVRGLEALDQPADVTVVTRSATVLRGLTRGLNEWRNNHWRWERFGRLTPIRDADLWQRVDQALRYHTVHCRSWRFDQPAERSSPPRPHFARRVTRPAAADRLPETESWIEGRPDSPAMVIVRTPRSRRRVRLAEPVSVAC